LAARTGGTDTRRRAAIIYAIVTGLIAISCVVNTFSNARDISWRLGSPHNLWEPALWELTSGIVVAALVPLARHGAGLMRSGTRQPLRAVFGNAVLLVTFSVLHIAGMGLLRELAYRLAGWTYSYPWAHEALYEFRKDIFAYAAIAVMFWLAERPTATPVEPEAETVGTDAAAAPATSGELWLRDGRLSILANPDEIVWVGSAGNYVEFRLTNARTHLIRTTLQAQEARLARFGIVRVHRGRLINPKRIVALEWRASGDFEIRLETGETVVGSRRFKAAVMAMGVPC
jgi:DNA-binding LytR/AlgR family response regulator